LLAIRAPLRARMTPVAARRIPTRTNLALAAAIALANVAALLVLPALGARSRMVTIAVAAIAAFASPTHWALIHEAIHGVLLPNRRANDALARVLAILFGVPFRAVRFAHLRHHRYNRTPWGREEVFDATTQPRLVAHAFHYARITVGLYVGELALSILCWLPRAALRRRIAALCPPPGDGTPGMAAFGERDLLKPAALAEIRVDAIAVVALLGAAAWLYGAAWPILAALLGIRALLSSQLDHAAHHGTPLDERDYALNLRAPRWIGAWLLNFNLHRTHHQHPHLPWRALPSRTTFGSGDIAFADAVARQWRGPIELSTLTRGGITHAN
jgi:fatty acid desaturase